jgi:hypothetical protein
VVTEESGERFVDHLAEYQGRRRELRPEVFEVVEPVLLGTEQVTG